MSTGPERQGWRASRWWFAGAAILLVVIAAAATPEGFGGAFRTVGRDRVVLPEGLRIHQYLLGAIAALLAAVYVAAQIVARREGVALPTRRSPWRLVAGLLLVVMIVNFVPVIRDRLDAWFSRTGQATEQPQQPDRSVDPIAPESSRVLGYVLAGVMAAIFLSLVAVLWLLLGREPRPRARPPSADDELDAALEEGLADLEAIDEPRAAVLACYARLQRAADSARVGRRRSDAPFELLDRLLEDGRADPGAARRLTALFEIARFSPHTVDDAMRNEAIAALGSLRKGLVAVR
jgi:disulfide bond formation protein DsbB